MDDPSAVFSEVQHTTVPDIIVVQDPTPPRATYVPPLIDRFQSDRDGDWQRRQEEGIRHFEGRKHEYPHFSTPNDHRESHKDNRWEAPNSRSDRKWYRHESYRNGR